MKRRIARRGFLRAAGAAAAGPVIISRKAEARKDAGPLNAKVLIEPEALHELPVTQYGHFIEHLGKCIKGGIWAEGESEDMFLGGVRRELIDAMRSINPPLIRYPGGCFADGYHWRDGIGPRSERPRRKNLAWGRWGPLVGPVEDNRFGTDEFCRLCGEVGAEPMLTANVGSGTAEEAAAWVEYCNGSKDTKWGAERARNGRVEPYNVRYWFVGNEIFGWHEIGHQTPEVYVKTFREYHDAMKKVDPSIILIAVGSHMPFKEGPSPNRTMLEGAGDIIDYLSIHQYVPAMDIFSNRLKDWHNIMRFQVGNMQSMNIRGIYYDIIGTLDHMERFVESNVRDIHAWSPAGKKVPLSFDEYNLWFNFLEDITHSNYNLRDGLWTASMLNIFHRHAPDMPLCNYAQMVNCLGMITSTKKGTFLTPAALAFKMYTENAQEKLLPSKVESPPVLHETGIPALDISATRGRERLSLFMVNRHYDAEVVAECSLKGIAVETDARLVEMWHENPAQYNTFNNPEAVKIKERAETLRVTREGGASNFSVRLAPHSLACLVLNSKGL